VGYIKADAVLALGVELFSVHPAYLPENKTNMPFTLKNTRTAGSK